MHRYSVCKICKVDRSKLIYLQKSQHHNSKINSFMSNVGFSGARINNYKTKIIGNIKNYTAHIIKFLQNITNIIQYTNNGRHVFTT